MLMHHSLTGRAKPSLFLKFTKLRDTKMATTPVKKKKNPTQGSSAFSVLEDTEETGIAYGIMKL